MSNEIRADYEQRWLFPPSVEEWVPAEHPARLIRDLVDAVDLDDLGFERRVGDEGRPNYATDLLLKVWLYGYLNRLRSSRRLERACHEHLSLVWLTGQHYPDHNTLWRFWQSNRAALKRVYKWVVQFAVQQGVVGFVLHALDGTKIAAHGARDKGWTQAQLEELLAELDAVVEAGMEQVEATEASEAGAPGYELPREWMLAALRRERVREALGQLAASERTRLHPQEPDARLMKTRREGTTWAHNAQAVVDADSGLIVGAAVTAEETDNHQMIPMLDQVAETTGQVATDTVTDSGYADGRALEQAEQKGYGVLVPQPSQQPQAENPRAAFHVSRFAYDAGQDCWRCPREEALRFETEKVKHGEVVRVYRCTVFQQCPVRWRCSRDPKGRTVSLNPRHAVQARQAAKQQQPDKRQLLRRRREIVEAPFGFIKEVFGFRRFSAPGTANAAAQWSLVCTAYNLYKLLPLWRAGRLRFA